MLFIISMCFLQNTIRLLDKSKSQYFIFQNPKNFRVLAHCYCEFQKVQKRTWGFHDCYYNLETEKATCYMECKNYYVTTLSN